MTTKRLWTTAAAALGLAGVALMVPSTAAAHDPIVTGSTECRESEESPWFVTWVVESGSANADLTWEIEIPSGYPSGQRAFDETFSRMASYPADQASATETVRVVYYIEGEFDKKSTRSGEVLRPPVCEQPTTTLEETTTTSTSTTTTPTTTPTTQPPTTVPETTEPEETTTTVSDSSGGTTTTTIVGSSGGTTTTTIAGSSSVTTTTVRLPVTGAGGTADTFWIGFILIVAGGSILVGTRRRPA